MLIARQLGLILRIPIACSTTPACSWIRTATTKPFRSSKAEWGTLPQLLPCNYAWEPWESSYGDSAAARDAFQAALATDPNLDVAYVGLAQTYAREANDREAIRILEAARSTVPTITCWNIISACSPAGSAARKKRLVHFRMRPSLNPNPPTRSLNWASSIRRKRSGPRHAVRSSMWLAFNPQFEAAHFQLSRVYGHLGLKKQADEEAQETRALVEAQRTSVLRRQRERAAVSSCRLLLLLHISNQLELTHCLLLWSPRTGGNDQQVVFGWRPLKHQWTKLLPLLMAFPLCLGRAQGPPVLGLSLTTTDRLTDSGWWPTKGTAPRSTYVGAETCKGCHARIAQLRKARPCITPAYARKDQRF